MRVLVEIKCLEIESDTHQILGKGDNNLRYHSPERGAWIPGVYVREVNKGSNLRVCNMAYIKQAHMA